MFVQLRRVRVPTTRTRDTYLERVRQIIVGCLKIARCAWFLFIYYYFIFIFLFAFLLQNNRFHFQNYRRAASSRPSNNR